MTTMATTTTIETNEVSLSTTICQNRIHLSTCIYNASGPRTGSSEALAKIAQSRSGGILAKSATLESQEGNPQPRTWQSGTNKSNGLYSLNSEGLPNKGIEYYLKDETIAAVLQAKVSTNDKPSSSSSSEICDIIMEKPYMVSISGHTLKDNLTMLQQIIDTTSNNVHKIAAVELNLACPNVIGHPIIAYDFAQMEDVLKSVSETMKKNFDTKNEFIPLGVKMPPYFDGPHFEEAAKILNKYKDVVSYVASINTIGNALAVDSHSEMPVISSNDGFAGLSGPAVKHTALANVRMMRTLLHEDIDVIGVGGVKTGTDAFEMILCGASAVQVGTCHWTEGPSCFDRICKELEQIMFDKGYHSIKDFHNKLKPWSKEGAQASRFNRKIQEHQMMGNLSKKHSAEFDFLNLILIMFIGILVGYQQFVMK